jgi:hypothetical protein
MPDVLLNNDEITVLGSPPVVELLVDIGPKGDAGSQVLVGLGNPNTISIGQTPKLNDLYINASPGTNYGYLYQYVLQPGGETWVEVLKISPTIYTEIRTTTFTSGNASMSIPISSISSITGLTAENFAVRYSIAHSNPIASSMQIPTLSSPGDTLVVNLDAVESSSGTWQNLSGEVTVHLFISIVV